MKKLMLSIALATIVCAAPKAFADDTRTETPPAEPGDIYIIFHYAKNVFGSIADTWVTVDWGGYSHTDSYQPSWWSTACGIPENCEFVIKLRHRSSDQIPLTVRTNGQILEGPYQGSAPRYGSLYPVHSW